MVNESQLVEVIKQAKESDKDRKFTQSVEMIMVFRDVDVKKGFAINETVQLPKKSSKPATVCIMASGDLGIKAKNAKADLVVDENELAKLSGDKKKSKNIINKYDFFLADTKLMPTDALTPIPSKESSISMVNFLINFFLIRRLILLYNTDGLIPNFFESIGTEIFPSLVNSKSNFISSSSNPCNDRKKRYLVINVDFIYSSDVNFN